MTHQELLAHSVDVFRSHPAVTTLYMTTDGLSFLKKADAETHARSYGLSVKPVLRAMVLAAPKEDAPSAEAEQEAPPAVPKARKPRKPKS